eukprot:PhM_4_TR12722/c0_g1_i1/m.33616
MALDPEHGLPLADYTWLPLSLHQSFQETLERDDGIARLLFLSAVDRITPTRGAASRVLVVSPRALYLCTPEADINRCVPIAAITDLYHTDDFVGLVVPSQFDLLLRLSGPEMAERLTGVLQHLLLRGGHVRIVHGAEPVSLLQSLHLERPLNFTDVPEPIDILEWQDVAMCSGVEHLMANMMSRHVAMVRSFMPSSSSSTRTASTAFRRPEEDSPHANNHNSFGTAPSPNVDFAAAAPPPSRVAPSASRNVDRRTFTTRPDDMALLVGGNDNSTPVSVAVPQGYFSQRQASPPQQSLASNTEAPPPQSIVEPLVAALRSSRSRSQPNSTTYNTASNTNSNNYSTNHVLSPATSPPRLQQQHTQQQQLQHNEEYPGTAEHGGDLHHLWEDLAEQRRAMEETCKRVESIVAQRQVVPQSPSPDSATDDAAHQQQQPNHRGQHVVFSHSRNASPEELSSAHSTPLPGRLGPPRNAPQASNVSVCDSSHYDQHMDRESSWSDYVPQSTCPTSPRVPLAAGRSTIPDVDGLTTFQRSLLEKLMQEHQPGYIPSAPYELSPPPRATARRRQSQATPQPHTPSARGYPKHNTVVQHGSQPPPPPQVVSVKRLSGARHGMPAYAAPTVSSMSLKGTLQTPNTTPHSTHSRRASSPQRRGASPGPRFVKPLSAQSNARGGWLRQ